MTIYTITFSEGELAAVDEALAITEPEDRLPEHEAAFAKVRAVKLPTDERGPTSG